ncbi:hypothetical protein MHYP_G00077020 [Metynnis hypsauchen]
MYYFAQCLSTFHLILLLVFLDGFTPQNFVAILAPPLHHGRQHEPEQSGGCARPVRERATWRRVWTSAFAFRLVSSSTWRSDRGVTAEKAKITGFVLQPRPDCQAALEPRAGFETALAAGCSVALKRRRRANTLNSVACFITSPEHQNPVAHLQKIWLCHSYPPLHS